jgi:dienelactone hydrolase
MKKILLIILMLIVGCSKPIEKEETIYISDSMLLSEANEVVNNLIDNDRDVSKKLSDSFKEEIPGNTLLKIYNDYVHGLTYIKNDESYIVNDVCVYNYVDYDYKTVKVYMCFDKELKVESLIINDLRKLPELTDNEFFKEEAVLVGNLPYLNGILTLPKNVKKPPVVVMVSGSGPNDLNSTIYENKPFEDLAYGLAMQGIASIRFDKRTYAFPESMNNITIEEEYFYDVSSAIHMLENYDVDPYKIYYLGHSFGGMISFSIMHQHPELKGAILLAGSPRKLEEIIYDQAKNTMIDSGMSEAMINENLKAYEDAIDLINNLNEESEDTKIFEIDSKYWLSLNNNSFENFKDINRKFLILQGEKDFQIFMDKDFEMFKEEYKDNKFVTLKSYENLNHLFMESINGTIDEYTIKSNVSSEVIDDIVSWINGKDILKEKNKNE